MMILEYRVELAKFTQIPLEENIVLIMIIELGRSSRREDRPFEVICRVLMVKIRWLGWQVVLLNFLTNQLVLESNRLISNQTIIVIWVHQARWRFILFRRDKRLEFFVSDKLQHLLLFDQQMSFLLSFYSCGPLHVILSFLACYRVSQVVSALARFGSCSHGCGFVDLDLFFENLGHSDFFYT